MKNNLSVCVGFVFILGARSVWAQGTEPATPAAAPGCFPACRVGYLCSNGQCVSACNPPCGAGEECQTGGQCTKTRTLTTSEPATAGQTVGDPTQAKERSFLVGAMGGPLVGGAINTGGIQRDTNSGFVLRAHVDSMLAPRFSMGAYAMYVGWSLDNGADTSLTTVAVGGVLKGYFGNTSKVHFRAGIAVGYQSTGVDMTGVQTVSGLGVAPIAELAIPISPRANILLHGSFISQPTGGTDNLDVTWDPIVYLAAGSELGF